MLSKSVLAAPERVRQASLLRKPEKDLLEGDHFNLWLEGTATDKPSSKKNPGKRSTKSHLARVKELAELGQYGRAAKTLVSKGQAAATVCNLKERHPA